MIGDGRTSAPHDAPQRSAPSAGESRSMSTPERSTKPEKEPACTPRSLCSKRSRTPIRLLASATPTVGQSKPSSEWVPHTPRFHRTTAVSPLASGRAHTSCAPHWLPLSWKTRRPCLPSGSWSTAITSLASRTAFISSDSRRRSLPIMSGAAMMDHSAICAFACGSESPKFPTRSMSGSFHAPGPCAASMPLASAWSPTQSTMPLTDS
mmetsp:Transcript_38525/g.126026  ORF Transcript_38525/g.126026 Transcript_38525/m.126026 type:complete len:208 (-) Transcript_38525:754-1377(-)